MNKIIKYSIAMLFGLIVLAIIIPESKTIYVEKECEICSCADQELKITKLKKVIELDNEAFVLTGDYMGKLDYWLYHPLEAEHELNKYTTAIEKIADEKWKIMSSL